MRERGVDAALWLGPALGIGLLVVLLVLLQAFVGQPTLAHQPASDSPTQMSPAASPPARPAKANAGGSLEGWQTVFSETFESGIGPHWGVTDTSTADGGDYTWGARGFAPGSPITAAWCVGGGGDGIGLIAGVDDYPDHVDSWLIYDLELTEAWSAHVQFSWWMEGNGSGEAAAMQRIETTGAAPDQGDWLGWCVLTDATDLEGAQCTYVSSAAGAWMRGVIPLDDHLPATEGVTETVSIAFHFLSDGDGQVGRGAFVDDVALRLNRGYEAFLPLVRTTDSSVEWNYPVITRGSRIGVHAIASNKVVSFAQELMDAGTHFPVVKVVDDFGWVADAARESPETIFIGRRTWPWGEGCQGVADPEFDMAWYAGQAIQRILDAIEANEGLEDVIDYWEVYNEPDPNEPTGVEGHRALAQLMIETMEEAERHDLKIALFSFNTGTPEWEELEALVETGVFRMAKAGGHIMALHEGTLTSNDPVSGWGPIQGWPVVDGAGFLNFRYRYLYHLLKQRNEVIPLVVSEWYCGDEQAASTQTLVDGVKWYDGEASKDYYFWAVCPFTLGPTSQWVHTDYERVYEGGLVDYMIAIKERQNAVPPVQSGAASLPSGPHGR